MGLGGNPKKSTRGRDNMVNSKGGVNIPKPRMQWIGVVIGEAQHTSEIEVRGGTTWTGYFKCREVKTGFCRNRSTQTGSSGTLIGWKSGQSTFVPLWDRMEGAWLRTREAGCARRCGPPSEQQWQWPPRSPGVPTLLVRSLRLYVKVENIHLWKRSGHPKSCRTTVYIPD
jgi:hypothetical protein